MPVWNQILLLKKMSKNKLERPFFYHFSRFLAGKHNSEHSAATSAVVFELTWANGYITLA